MPNGASRTHFSDRYADREPIDLIERILLGTLIVCPQDRERAKRLRPADFRSTTRGHVFEQIMAMPKLDAVLLMQQMRLRTLSPPANLSWAGAIGLLMDDLCVDEEIFDAYVEEIVRASAERRLSA